MDDAFLVGGGQATGDLDGAVKCFADRERTGRKTVA